MLELCEKKDVIYLQYAFYRKARCIDSPDKCCSALLDALAITIPDFNFNRLHNYRFSWIELTILHNFCEVYSLRFPSKGISYLYNILEYYSQASLDILEEKRLLPISLYLLISLLYQQKHFSEILTLDVFVSDISVKFFLRYAGATYSHYAQALGELKQTDLLYRYSNYSYYNFLMLNFYTHAASIKNVVARDFQIQLF